MVVVGRKKAVLAVIAAVLSLAACAVRAETVTLVATADVGVSSHRGETDASMGKTPRFRLKNIEEMVLLNFDLRPLRGKRIQSAWLHMRTDPESAQRELVRLRIPPSQVDPLRYIGVSTVSSPWVEGAQAVSYRPDPEDHGATFSEASFGRDPWAWKGSTLADAIMGNGQSVHSHAPLVRENDMWWKVPVDRAVIETLLAEGGFGLCVMDESGVGGELGANTDVFSRESGRWAPYLTVETESARTEPPKTPTDLAASPAPEKAGRAAGAVRLQLRVSEGAVAYHVFADGRPLKPWQIARPGRAGETQTLYLTDFPPRAKFRIEIAAADGAGNLSPRSSVEAVASAALQPPPDLPRAGQVGRLSRKEPPARDGKLRVWAFPEMSKVDPTTGELMDEPDSATYRAANAVWNASDGAIRVAAARGEIVGFQVAVERLGASLTGVRVELSPLRGASQTIERDRIRLWRAWYVKSGHQWHAEVALPLDKPFDVPTRDNGVLGQRNQTVWVDVAVPANARPGTYEGTLTISAERFSVPVALKVTLEVFDVAIPENLNFWGELNGYDPPGEPGSDYFYDAHRLAHYHRCAINTVPYSQHGSVQSGYAPTLEGRGAEIRVADWTAFDRNLGPLLDGLAFAKNPRAGVPIQVLYLPLFENWPLPIAAHYAYKGRPGPDTLVLHHLLAPPIEQAFDDAYRRGWTGVAREFVRHFDQKGWNRTIAEFYLNNKWQFGGTSWWLLDEPASRDDFLALRFFGRMWREATGEAKTARMLFRGDISRPQWQGDLLDGLMQIEYDNGEMFNRERTDQALAERMPAIWCTYGACNEVGESNLQTAAWCLRAYVAGANAVLPWSSLDNEGKSLTAPNPNGLIVNGKSLGYGPVASFRVFALRRGAQDVEILRSLAEKRGWKREQIGLLASRRVPLAARFRQAFLDEAAAARFAGLSARGFVELKEGALRLLVGQ
jgi:hypothetical protein